jgi:uncharacterized protein YdeI (YjbR/CyaY-like superfamily)
LAKVAVQCSADTFGVNESLVLRINISGKNRQLLVAAKSLCIKAVVDIFKNKNMNPKTDWFFNKQTKWQEAYSELRILVLDCKLTEELKWGCPCYTIGKSNIVLIHGFKEYCALLFMQGALLKDTKKILVQQTENVQSARQIRFKSVEEIVGAKSTIKSYIKEAIALEKAGLKVELKKTTEYKISEEFQTVLDDMPELKKAFQALTPGRQRGYLLYFSAPKQAKTRETRIEKCIQKIISGKGLDD